MEKINSVKMSVIDNLVIICIPLNEQVSGIIKKDEYYLPVNIQKKEKKKSCWCSEIDIKGDK
jgi:hypothetical protein